MGAREGTRPENDPITRSLTATARAEGRTEGRMEGVFAILRARGIHPVAELAAEPERFAGLGLDTLTDAALACTDEADFRRRIGEARRA